MREPENIRQVAQLGIDWMGFIFYAKSPRRLNAIDNGVARSPFSILNSQFSINKVGVFVDAPLEEMLIAAVDYKLDYLQLHGNESPDDCYALQKRGIALIKAFAVSSKDDLAQTADYEGRADYFLFDTRCSGYGGSGQSFDWSILAAYSGKTPFLLSGGIHPGSLEALQRFSHPLLAGIDLNSGFETAPGMKEVEKLKDFIEKIRQIDNKYTN